MQVIQTGEDLISFFASSAEKNSKVFFQTEKDDTNADRLIKFFNHNGGSDFARQCIDRFIASEKQPVVFLLDFVIKLGTISDEIKAENQDREEFRRLLRETQERMKGDFN